MASKMQKRGRESNEKDDTASVFDISSWFGHFLHATRIPSKYYSNTPSSSLDVLVSFMNATEMDVSEASLCQVLQSSRFNVELECIPSEFERDYADFEKRYHDVPVDIVLYFIDDQIMIQESVPLRQVESFQQKVIKIRSVLVWLQIIFPDGRKDRHWPEIFIDHDRETLKEHLDWLENSDQVYFMKGQGSNGGPIKQEDLDVAADLWKWLETHPRMPIKFVHTMVLYGMDRDACEIFEVGEAVNKVAMAIASAEENLEAKSHKERVAAHIKQVQENARM